MNYFVVCENYKNSGVEKKIEGQKSALKKIDNFKFIGYSEDRIFQRLIVCPLKIFFKLKDVNKIYYRYACLNILLHLILVIFYKKKFYLEINTKNRRELKMYAKKNLKGRIKYFSNLLFEKMLYKNAYKIITFTGEIKEYINEIYENKKTEIIDNGYFSNYQGKKLEKIQYKNLFTGLSNSNKKIAVFAGTFYKWAGVDRILDIIKDIEEIYLILIGFGPEKENIIDKIKNENIENVIYFGRANKKEINKIYEYCDFSFGSFTLERKNMKEARPLKVREYLIHGLPVVYNYYENKNLEEKKFVLNMKKNDKNSLIDFIDNLEGFNRNKIKQFARDKFDWYNILKKVIK